MRLLLHAMDKEPKAGGLPGLVESECSIRESSQRLVGDGAGGKDKPEVFSAVSAVSKHLSAEATTFTCEEYELKADAEMLGVKSACNISGFKIITSARRRRAVL